MSEDKATVSIGGGGLGDAGVADTLMETLGALDTVDLRSEEAAGALETTADTGRYRELREIGRGGLGYVLEAFDEDLRRTVAIKRPRDDRQESQHLISLVREAQITAQLEHPNIPPIHALGVDEAGQPYFSMTCLHGSSLGALLRRAQTDPELRHHLSLPRKLRIFLQVGYALAFAHSRGVVHRDLKPENIMIGEFGEVRLMDWGIAKLLDEPDAVAERDAPSEAPAQQVSTTADMGETQEGGFMGTPGYASPEQAEGRVDLDERSDIYSLGAILYELVAGRRPILGKTSMETLVKTMEGEVPPVTRYVPVSDRLAAVVHKALARDRDDRYSNVRAMLEDIEAVLEGRPVAAHEEGTLERLGKWYMSRPPRLARLQMFHVDWGCGGSFMIGVAAGCWNGAWLGAGFWNHVVALASLVVGIIMCAPMIYTMARKPRPDDPGAVIPYTEGVVSTRTRPREAMVEGDAPTLPSDERQ